MSKWEEIGNNALVGAPKHSLAGLKEHIAIQRIKPIKQVKEDKTKEAKAKKKERLNGANTKKKRSEAERD